MPEYASSTPSMEKNVTTSATCEAVPNGTTCGAPAHIPHQLGAWPGHWDGGETVWLCTRCDNMLWTAALAAHEVRVQTRLREQEKSA